MAAVAERVLGEVLLVRLLGVVVRRGLAHLGGDLAEAPAALMAMDAFEGVGISVITSF